MYRQRTNLRLVLELASGWGKPNALVNTEFSSWSGNLTLIDHCGAGTFFSFTLRLTISQHTISQHTITGIRVAWCGG